MNQTNSIYKSMVYQPQTHLGLNKLMEIPTPKDQISIKLNRDLCNFCVLAVWMDALVYPWGNTSLKPPVLLGLLHCTRAVLRDCCLR